MGRWVSIAALGSLLCSCHALPEDHAVRLELERSYDRVQHAFDLSRHLETEVRRIPRLMATARKIAPTHPSHAAKVAKIPGTVRALGRRAAAGPKRVETSALALLQRDMRAAQRLRREDSTLRRITSLDRASRRIEKLADRLPQVLDLERQPLPSPSDAYQQTEAGAKVRREGWLERIVRRIRL